MAIIPRYTSRALPPGAQPGMIESAQKRGRAGARLAAAAGDTIIAGIDFKNRKDKEKAREDAYWAKFFKDADVEAKGLGKSIEDFPIPGEPSPETMPDGRTVPFGDSASAKTGNNMATRTIQQKQVGATLDRQSDETLLASFETAMTQARATAQAAARKPTGPAKNLARAALAQFDREVVKLSKGLEDRPYLKSRFDALADSSRAPLELRMLTLENARRVDEEKAALSDSLSGLARAAIDDPAMAPGVTGRGFAQIESAMQAGMLDAEEAAAMQGAFAENVHMSAMRGQIAVDPEGTLARLESGEFDDIFVAPSEAGGGYAGLSPREIAGREGFDSGFFEELMPGLPLDEEIVLNDLVDRGPWRSPGKTFDPNDITTLLPDRPREDFNPDDAVTLLPDWRQGKDIDPKEFAEKLPRRFQETPGGPKDWLRLAFERYDGKYGLDREKLERLLPNLLARPVIGPRELLIGEARTTARLKTAGASAAARAKRRGLEIDMADHLAALDEAGAGDEAVAARAQAELPDFQYAAFQASAAQARERHATRAEYAFMTPAEIEADIARRAEGGPANIDRRDGDQRAAGHTLRTAIRDEVLTARATDPAGWAMRDDAVAASFTAAQENPDNPALALHAGQQRIALQREMGIEQPRLLSDAERDEIAGALAQATPADRPALIADLRARYGAQADMLAKELSGRVAPDTGVLLAHAGDSPLTGALARGMAMDSVEFTGARVLTLPMIDGKLDSSRLEDKQLYTFMAGDRVVSVIYDRKADALVPAFSRETAEEGGEGGGSGQMGRIRSGIHGAGQEVANVVAAVPKSQAFFAAEIARSTLEDMLAIQMGEEPYWVHRDHADKATLFRFRQASPKERLRMLADQASVFPRDSSFYKFGEAISAYAREALPTNPDYEDELFQKLMRGGGGLGGYILIGAALRRAGVPPIIGVAATGATTQMVAQFEDALGKGATMEEAYEAANLGSLVGLTEALPIARLFDRLDKGTGGSIRRALIEAAKGGAEEVLQETFQTVMKSLIASDLVGYDPDRRIFEGLGENAGISFTLGGVVNFVAAIAGGRRSASDGQTREDTAPGADSALEDVGNAPSGEAVAEEGVSGVETVARAELDVSVPGTEIDWNLVSGYEERSRHKRFVDPNPSTAEPGREGSEVFGSIDPNSGKLIVQPINDAGQMVAMARKNVEPLSRQLTELVVDLPGVEFVGARAKENAPRMAQKLDGGRRHDTMGDYLGGRIVFNNNLMLNETVRVLARRYKTVEFDNFMVEPRPSGYRAIHMQIVLDNGMTAEIQVMPRKIYEVYLDEHAESYTPGRGPNFDLSEKDIRIAEATKEKFSKRYERAWKEFLGEADDE